jgi:glycosyltransferase involved in cell wall biosynthesis
MNILIMTNMGPSVTHPFSDVPVRLQVDTIRRLSGAAHQVDYFNLRRHVTSLWGSLAKYALAFVRFLPTCMRRYDIVHLHYGYPLLAFVFVYKLLHPNAGSIVTFLGSDLNYEMSEGMRRRFFRFLLRRVDRIVTVSEALSEQAGRILSRRADYVISAGVDTSVFYPLPQAPKRYELLFVGRFVEGKGVRYLLEALRQLRGLRLRACFAGSGPLLGEIEAASKDCDVTVALNASADDLRMLYNAARFLILPSESEGLPAVVGEALACGTPVIATRVGGIGERLVDGLNGFFLVAPSAGAIVTKLRELQDLTADRYQQLVDNTRLGVEVHTLEAVGRAQIAMYRELAGHQCAAPGTHEDET